MTAPGQPGRQLPASLAAAMRLGERLAELDRYIAELKVAELDAVTKRHDADVHEWKVFLSTAGAMELRKITARLAAEELAFEADKADAQVRHLVRQVKAAQTRVDVGRTYSADLRAEAAVHGRYGPGDGTP